MNAARPARNFLAPGERRRLFWMLVPAGVALIVVLGWVERTWFPRPRGGQPQVDTRLEAVAGRGPQGDEVVIERDPVPLEHPAMAALSASLDSLAKVRDATVFRDADNDAWFQTWTTLRDVGLDGLRRARPQQVGFRELFGQPRSFRGRLVRMQGTLHRAEQLTAPRNDYGVESYWQCWMEPAGGPASPVVVQCLALPAGMPSGMDIEESVEILGYFFKNYAYNAADAIRVAPLIMTLEPIRLPSGPAASRGPSGTGDLLPAVAAAARVATKPGSSLESFLAIKQIAVGDRAAVDAAAPWGEDQERVLVKVISRLAAPAPLLARWRDEAAAVSPRGEPTSITDRLVKVHGRATFVAPRRLPADLAERLGRASYDLVRIVDERAAVVDVVVPRAPVAWARWRPIDEPAEAWALPLTAKVGPSPVGTDTFQAWPDAAHDLLVAATAVSWQPPTPLGQLGMDYALFDTVVDDRKLEPGDTEAFWRVMAAARRTTPAEVARAAGRRTDVLDLIDPARKWFASHRGDPVVIDGVARRATRIVIDDPDRREAVGDDHYWELEVFADTPTIKVNERIQDRYPIVCCVAKLPAGMPSGEDISERVRVPAFGFKRYSYPLRDPQSALPPAADEVKGERVSTALVIGPGVEWLRPPSPAGASNLLFGVFAGILCLLGAVFTVNAWMARRDRRAAERRRREAMPERLDLPSE